MTALLAVLVAAACMFLAASANCEDFEGFVTFILIAIVILLFACLTGLLKVIYG